MRVTWDLLGSFEPDVPHLTLPCFIDVLPKRMLRKSGSLLSNGRLWPRPDVKLNGVCMGRGALYA